MGPFKEFSVVYTDRALNLMSPPFCDVMQRLSSLLCKTYNASKCVMIPGSGSFAMESVARQFVRSGDDRKPMVLRNGGLP